MNFTHRLWKFALLFMLATGCHTLKNKQPAAPAFDKQGHRGCRGLMPENTIPAMLKALELGVTTLEMDAMITKDEKVILSHDPYFSHHITTKADGSYIDSSEEKKHAIFSMTYAETQQYDVGLKVFPAFPRQQKLAAHKPLLVDMIDSVELRCKKEKRKGPFYNIETKCKPATDNILHPAPGKFVDLLMEAIYRKGIAERVIIQSFDFRTLKILHEKYPAIKTAALIDAGNRKSVEEQIQALGFTPTIYSPELRLVNGELVSSCHQHNMKIIPWTVNDKNSIEKLRSLGVDGIISDYPDLF